MWIIERLVFEIKTEVSKRLWSFKRKIRLQLGREKEVEKSQKLSPYGISWALNLNEMFCKWQLRNSLLKNAYFNITLHVSLVNKKLEKQISSNKYPRNNIHAKHIQEKISTKHIPTNKISTNKSPKREDKTKRKQWTNKNKEH